MFGLSTFGLLTFSLSRFGHGCIWIYFAHLCMLHIFNTLFFCILFAVVGKLLL
jgi:hypothetical protein